MIRSKLMRAGSKSHFSSTSLKGNKTLQMTMGEKTQESCEKKTKPGCHKKDNGKGGGAAPGGWLFTFTEELRTSGPRLEITT